YLKKRNGEPMKYQYVQWLIQSARKIFGTVYLELYGHDLYDEEKFLISELKKLFERNKQIPVQLSSPEFYYNVAKKKHSLYPDLFPEPDDTYIDSGYRSSEIYKFVASYRSYHSKKRKLQKLSKQQEEKGATQHEH